VEKCRGSTDLPLSQRSDVITSSTVKRRRLQQTTQAPRLQLTALLGTGVAHRAGGRQVTLAWAHARRSQMNVIVRYRNK